MKPLGKIENLHSWKSFFKNLNFFANWFNRWNELINFKTSQTTCLKNENFYRPIWTMKWIDHHQNFNAQKACLKTQSFLEALQSRKWSEIYENFKDQIACLKKLNFWQIASA